MNASSTMSGVCTLSGGGLSPGLSGSVGAAASGAGDGSAVPDSTDPGMCEVITTRVPSGL